MNIKLDEIGDLTDEELERAIALLTDERNRRRSEMAESLPEKIDSWSAMTMQHFMRQPQEDNRKPWQKQLSSQDKDPSELINREKTIELLGDLWKQGAVVMTLRFEDVFLFANAVGYKLRVGVFGEKIGYLLENRQTGCETDIFRTLEEVMQSLNQRE